MFEPFGKLKELAHAIVVWSRPHIEVPAATDGRHIWIDPNLSGDEKLCALAHEAIHIKHGHSGCQPPAIERQVRLETAQYLVSFQDLQRVAGWARHPAEMAEELGVTEQVLLDRLATLDGDQVQQLWPAYEYIA